MKLLETKIAPNPRRVRFFLAEKGIEVPGEEVDLGGMQHRQDEFLAINPFATVPVLVLDDGTAISETVAICRYFEETQPAPALMGTTPVEKATVEMWHRRVELTVFTQIAQSFRHLHPRMAAREVPQVAEWGEANKAKAPKTMEMFNNALSHGGFLAGEHFSIADIALWIALDFAKVAQLEIPETCGHLSAWKAKVDARPAVAILNGTA